MSKKLLLFLISATIHFLYPKLQQDLTTMRYYTTPATAIINQNDYHQFVWLSKDIQKQSLQYQQAEYDDLYRQLAPYMGSCSRSSAMDRLLYLQNNMQTLAHQRAIPIITDLLHRAATPTSIQLLNDLKEIDFKIP